VQGKREWVKIKGWERDRAWWTGKDGNAYRVALLWERQLLMADNRERFSRSYCAAPYPFTLFPYRVQACTVNSATKWSLTTTSLPFATNCYSLDSTQAGIDTVSPLYHPFNAQNVRFSNPRKVPLSNFNKTLIYIN